MNWKKSLLFCASFIIIFFGEIAINVACGPEQDPYDYYVSYFHNTVAGDRYHAFSFNDMVYLYNSDDQGDEAEINSKEWATYLNVQKEDVKALMYDVDSITNLKLQRLSSVKLSDFSDSWQRNTFLQALYRNKPALKYFEVAKHCEPFVSGDYDSWDPVARDSSMMIKKAVEVAKLADAETELFLKLRYGFQVVRLYHYANNYESCKIAYEKLVRPLKINSAAQGWAMSAYAGALRFTGNESQAAYLFSKVFITNPERRIQAYRNYFYAGVSVSTVLNYAKSDSESGNIWAIQSFGTAEPDMRGLQKVYDYMPQSEILGTLLVREVNKLEQKLIRDGGISNTSYVAYFGNTADENAERKRSVQHLIAVRNFALKLAHEKRYPTPELGMLTAAYLSWMAQDDVLALYYLGKLNPSKLPERLKDQYRITELLIKANRIKKGSELNEVELLPALKWLDEKRYKETERSMPDSLDRYDDYLANDALFTKTTRNLYQQILAPAYLKMGDTAKAALAMLKGDLFARFPQPRKISNYSYATSTFWREALGPKTMLRLANFKRKPKTNNFEGLLTQTLNNITDDDFNELFGTTFLRSHDYAKASWCFEKVKNKAEFFNASDWGVDVLYSNPFIETINDYPKSFDSTATSNNKLSFAKKMHQLQQLVLSNKKNAAEYYYQMATGIYQTGHYGNAWFLVSYRWSSYENGSKPTYFYQFDYKHARTAKAWYLKARSLSKDLNFQSKCTYMLAKCEQKRLTNNLFSSKWYNDLRYDESNNAYLKMNNSNPYYSELKLTYSKTKFFRTAVGDCSYLSDFLKRSR